MATYMVSYVKPIEASAEGQPWDAFSTSIYP